MNAPVRTDAPAAANVLRGRFELLEVIGRGGASLVCRAADRLRILAGAPDPEVAVKMVSSDGDFGSWTSERVHREARHLRDLRHPNIVDVVDSDQDGSIHFIVFELLKGRTIAQILPSLPRRTVPLDLVLRILEGTVTGLRHAHRRGVIHADLKPSNIFITNEGTVKLLDFGAARLIGTPNHPAQAQPESEQFDAITPLYASPEMLRGESPEEPHDVFGLAVLTYVMLTGQHPFKGKTATAAQTLGLRAQRPPGLSGARWLALTRALRLDPRERTGDVETFGRGFATPRLLDRLLG